MLCDPVPSTSAPASSAPVTVAETGSASTPSSALQVSADPVPSTSTPASSAPVIVAANASVSPVLPGLCMSCERDPPSTSESILALSDQVPSTSSTVSSKIVCDTSFSELMPTPKIEKRNVKAPRKSLNYRANCVRKELFTNSCNSKNMDNGSENMEPVDVLESEKSSSVGRQRQRGRDHCSVSSWRSLRQLAIATPAVLTSVIRLIDHGRSSRTTCTVTTEVHLR